MENSKNDQEMSNTKRKLELFAKEVFARLKGDDDQTKSVKIARQALAALEGQLASLRAQIVNDEIAVETAEEALKSSIYPDHLITNPQAYCEGIAQAQENLDLAKEEQEETEKAMKFFQELLESI